MFVLGVRDADVRGELCRLLADMQVALTGSGGQAAGYTSLYPITSRCGVFAKSDVQPLLNQGAAHEDIAGLACGPPLRGNVVVCLGGPLHFLPQLRAVAITSPSGTSSLASHGLYWERPQQGHRSAVQG